MAARAKDSIRRVTQPKPKGALVRVLAAFFSLIAIATLVLGVLTFTSANTLMRQPPRDLQMIGSNIMPDYSLAGFPSFDEQSTLSGWFFPARGRAVSTVILVHDQGANRLQFGLDTPVLFDALTARGFNVLAFDLRNSGRSAGRMSGYGYAEWADVLAAIRYVRRITTTTNVILYGFGSGTAAALIALDQLPAAGSDLSGYSRQIQDLGFDRSYIAGLVLDTPAGSADDYIRAAIRENDIRAASLLEHTIPSAIRLSAGGIGHLNLITVLARTSLPVFIAYSEQDIRIGAERIEPLISERQRLHPDTTVIFAARTPGYISGFIDEQESYIGALDLYLTRFFTAAPSD